MNTRYAAAGLAALAIIVGCAAFYIVRHRRAGAPNHAPKIGSANLPGPAGGAPHNPDVKIFVAAPDNKGDENNLIAVSAHIVDAGSPARGAILALMSAPNSLFPVGTTLKHIRIENKLATVDFSSRFKEFHGSSSQGAQLLNSILKTLGQFSTIDKVQILVDGSPVDDLGGDYDIHAPLDVAR